jgi:hypothetical protein
MSETLPIFSEFGRWDVASSIQSVSPFRDVVHNHLASLDPEHGNIIARGLLEISRQHISDAVHRSPRVMALGAVAAHQEAEYIYPTLKQYARQKSAPPHQVTLFCNWPKGANQTAVGETIDRIDRFRYYHPDVPVRYFTGEVPPDAKIGYIRKLTFGVGLDIAAQGDVDDVLMMAHDADITALNRLFLARMDRAFRDPTKLVAALTADVRHERSNGRLPNLDSVVAWFDMNGIASDSMIELGNGFSARAAMEVGDYNPNDDTSETLGIYRRIFQSYSLNHPARIVVRGTRIVSSSRRPYHKLLDGIGPTEFWGTGNFHPTESYRDIDFNTAPDITVDEANDHIRTLAVGNDGYNVASHLLHRYLAEGRDFVDAQNLAIRTIEIGRLLLGGPEDLTNMIQLHYPTPIKDRIDKIAKLVAEGKLKLPQTDS